MNERETTEMSVGKQPGPLSVTFGLRGPKLDPVEITERLAIQPSHAFAPGDEYRTHLSRTEMGVRTRPFGVWQLSSEGVVQSEDLQDHVDYIAGLIGPKRAEIDGLLADPDVYVDVRFWIDAREDVRAFSLRSESVALLASLCRDFNVSVLG